MQFGQGRQSHAITCGHFILLVTALIAFPRAALVASAQETAPHGTALLSENGERVVTRVYATKRILQKTCETMHCTMNQAMQKVQTHLFGTADGRDASKVKSEWFGDELIVRQSITAHRKNGQTIESHSQDRTQASHDHRLACQISTRRPFGFWSAHTRSETGIIASANRRSSAEIA